MPQGGTAFEENNPLLGEASDGGRVAPKGAGMGTAPDEPTPALRDRVKSSQDFTCGRHPSMGGDFQ